MSYVVLTNQTLSDPADKTEVEDNFSDIVTTINGGIDTDNISELDVDKLTGQYYTVVLSAQLDYGTSGTAHYTFVIPGSGDTYSTNLGYAMVTDLGTSDGTITFSVGTWDGAGVWTATGSSPAYTMNTATRNNLISGVSTITTGEALRVTVVAPGTPVSGARITFGMLLKRKIHT